MRTAPSGVRGGEDRRALRASAGSSPAPRPAALLATALVTIVLLLSGFAALAPHAAASAGATLEAGALDNPPGPGRLVAIVSPASPAVSTAQRRGPDGPGGAAPAAAQQEPPCDDALYRPRLPDLAPGAALQRAFTPRCARAPPA